MTEDQQRRDDLEVSEAELLRRCDVTTYRASGPGGQKRNKTDSAVRLRHRLSGLMVIATESRSQHENRKRAVRRLRERIAAEVRDPVVLDDYRVPDALGGLLPGSAQPRPGLRTAGYVLAIKQLLDLFAAADCSVAATGRHLGLTTAAVSKLLLESAWAAKAANALRHARGLRPLR